MYNTHMKQVIESSYPITFREKEASELGSQLKQHHSVVLVGMKRVGISNFLRFFLNHNDIVTTYIKNGMDQIFIQVDLNDLIERNIFAFWTLLLTRVVDSVQGSTLPETIKRQCRKMFVQSIQLKDQFFTVDSLRKCLQTLSEAGYYPTLFLIRFDRLQDVATPEFLSNLLGLRDAVKQKLSYVFTSYRPLHELSPDVFKKQFLTLFSRDMYLPPMNRQDMLTIMDTLEAQYHTKVSSEIKKTLIDISGGYVQYLQIALIRIQEDTNIPTTMKGLLSFLSKDEQIIFQSEEMFESLTKSEKELLLAIKQGNTVSKEEKENTMYLWNTGIVKDEGIKTVLFSPLFDDYVSTLTMHTNNGSEEFTKKEHLLFTFLKANINTLCERESIIDAVWPENREMGVSDWAIDRLIARLRSKLKDQDSPYQIQTIVTRGYKMVEK